MPERIKLAMDENAKMLKKQRTNISYKQIDNAVQLLIASRSIFVMGAGG